MKKRIQWKNINKANRILFKNNIGTNRPMTLLYHVDNSWTTLIVFGYGYRPFLVISPFSNNS